MSTIHVVEATTMRLKLVSPKSYNQKTLFEGWSMLQSTSSHKPIDDCFKTDINSSYLHNQKSLKLSQKSLELCTESLGSESGNDMSDDDAIFARPGSSLSLRKSRRDVMESKKVLSRSFPPPLMTMSGSKLFQVRPHREGGRLVIEAVETDLGTSCLRAERSQGRLQLTYWTLQESGLLPATPIASTHAGNTDPIATTCEMEDSEKSDVEMEGNVESEKFQRVRRCNEDENGDKGICCKWEPSCWVAIS